MRLAGRRNRHTQTRPPTYAMLNGASPWWTTGRSDAETSRCEIRKVGPKVILARLPILQVIQVKVGRDEF